MTIPKSISYLLPTKNMLPCNKVNWNININRSVLLIHDMQKYFCNFLNTKNSKLQKFIDNIVILRNYCKTYNIPVIYTMKSYENNTNRSLLNDIWGHGLNNRIEEKNIIDKLTPNSTDKIIIKNRYSAFYSTSLEAELNNINRDQLIITGIYAHIGCLVTCIDAFTRNIQPFMIADAMADFSIKEHMMALIYTANCSGKVLMTNEVMSLPLNKNDLRHKIMLLLSDKNNFSFKNHENLIDYGINSIQIMELAAVWNTAKKNINFIELAKSPTINNWWSLLSKL